MGASDYVENVYSLEIWALPISLRRQGVGTLTREAQAEYTFKRCSRMKINLETRYFSLNTA